MLNAVTAVGRAINQVNVSAGDVYRGDWWPHHKPPWRLRTPRVRPSRQPCRKAALAPPPPTGRRVARR